MRLLLMSLVDNIHEKKPCILATKQLYTVIKVVKVIFSKEQIETTTDEEVAMVFSSSNLILCPPFSTETQVKKIPPLS